MTKEQNRIIRSLVRYFHIKYWFYIDLQSIESEAFFIYSWLSDQNKLGEENQGLRFYLRKRLMSFVRNEINRHSKNKIIAKRRMDDYRINNSVIDPDQEVDFRLGLDQLSLNAKILIEMIFNEKLNINKFNIQGIIRASRKTGMSKNKCKKAIKEIQTFLRSL